MRAIILALGLVSWSAHSADWHPLGTSTWYDAESIVTRGTLVDIRVKKVYGSSQPSTVPGIFYRRSDAVERYDCEGGAWVPVHLKLYADAEGRELVWSAANPRLVMRVVRTNSDGHRLLGAICRKQ